jgi:hypothetical protein
VNAAHFSASATARAARHFQYTVIDEEAHHRITIVGVECAEQPLERLNVCLV